MIFVAEYPGQQLKVFNRHEACAFVVLSNHDAGQPGLIPYGLENQRTRLDQFFDLHRVGDHSRFHLEHVADRSLGRRPESHEPVPERVKLHAVKDVFGRSPVETVPAKRCPS